MTAGLPPLPLPLLSLEAVTVRRDGRTLLDAVSFAVQPGTIHVIAGPNGGGKSTLLGVLLGAVPFEGRARAHWRRDGRIGLVPQKFGTDRTLPLTVGDFLALDRQRRPACLGIARATRTRIEEILARAGLEGFARRPLSALSGGELQRVLLANALDPTPELLLLDEPGSGLDETSARRLETSLLDLRAKGVTVLMVSHDLLQARRIADRLTVVRRSVVRDAAASSLTADDLLGAFLEGSAEAKGSA